MSLVPTIMVRAARLALGVLPILGVGMTVAACTPTPNCGNLEPKYADTPVKNMTQNQAEQTVWCLTNDQRVANGLSKLSLNSVLGGTARAHAQAAVNQQGWPDGANTHTSPEGTTPTQRIQAAHYCDNPTQWETAENTYWGWGTPLQTPRTAVNWWMGDPPHRATILSTTLKDIGVGVVLGNPAPGSHPDAAVFVQDFGTCVN
jgi:uncharacterized protein YkwD